MNDLGSLEQALKTRWLGRRCVLLASCSSTNDEAARLGRQGGEHGLIVVCDAQTGGRGRLGRAWHSPPGQNLYLSLLLRPQLPPWAVPPLTLLVGAVIAETLAAVGLAPRLKWPNDVLLSANEPPPRKVAGILTEMATERESVRHVVVGLGLNVNATDFPPALATRATSMRLAGGHSFDRAQVLASLVTLLEPAFERFVASGPSEAVARWRVFGGLPQRCRVERDGGILEGTALDLDPEGALIVIDDLGERHRVLSGEITAAG